MKKEKYKEFYEHLEEYEEKSIPIGYNDLMRLAKEYNLDVNKIR